MAFKPAKIIKSPSKPEVKALDKPKAPLHWIVKDAVVLACIGLAFFLFIVMFSYSPNDPGFDTVKAGQIAQNYGGRTGAWVSSFILYVFGVFGFLIPFGILLAGMVTLKIRAGSETDYFRFVMSLVGLFLMITAGSGLATLYLDPHNALIELPYSGGGILGYEVSQALVSGVDLLGTTLILLVVFAIAFSMMTSFSWLTIIDMTGVLTWKLWLQALKTGEKAQHKYQDKKATASNKAEPVLRIGQAANQKDQDTKVSRGLLGQKNKVIGTLAEKVKSKTKNMLETDGTVANNLPEKLPSIDLSSMDKESNQSDASALSGSRVKVGKKASANNHIPVIESGELPSVELLEEPPHYEEGYTDDELTALSLLLEQRLKEFGVSVKVEAVQPGPVVTRFEVLPAPGVKVSQINNLAKDLARVLSVKSVRVVDIIPGKSVVGIEIPNAEREVVSFREVVSSEEFQHSKSPLTVALGKDIAGKAVVADIAKMPHLLVAGTTGSGKSVGVNSMILSLLYKSTPEDVRLIMVDPKMLELSVYEDIPHLLTPVVTDMSDAANALRWSVFEMDRRYQLMAKLGVRNIAGFNAKVKGAIEKGEPIPDPLYQQATSGAHEIGESAPALKPLPYIVIVVDEFADMIMVVGKEVEQLIARIAQKARAAGIHLILATQRPSVNVITGLIKANIPTRISFMVNTKIDSRTILDQGGAEQLLGMGDMLFMPPGSGNPKRVHGAYMTDEEVHAVASFVKSQGEPQYLESVTQSNMAEGGDTLEQDAEQDLLYDQVVAFVVDNQRVSVSLVQRHFKIGYNRAARIVEAMESSGVVSTMKSNGNRDVLAPRAAES